jgi:hypothetical protein
LGGLVGFNAGLIRGSDATVAASVGNGDGGWNYLGGLVGYNGTLIGETTLLGRIEGSSSSGNLTGRSGSFIGGLVGQNDGNIYMSQSRATVTAWAKSDPIVSASLGGAVGYNTGLINATTASGNVDGGAFGNFVGGLAGQNLGLITTSTASGNVSGSGQDASSFALIGGLVGQNGTPGWGGGGDTVHLASASRGPGGMIVSSSAIGTVTGGDNTKAGGLTGVNLANAIVLDSFATSNVTIGNAGFAGGFAGVNNGSITNSHATGAVSGGNASILGGLVAMNLGSIDPSYATGNVSDSGTGTLGGLVGINLGSFNQSAATGAVTGGPESIVGGLVGINTTQGDPSLGTINQSYAAGAAVPSGTWLELAARRTWPALSGRPDRPRFGPDENAV